MKMPECGKTEVRAIGDKFDPFLLAIPSCLARRTYVRLLTEVFEGKSPIGMVGMLPHPDLTFNPGGRV